MMNVSKKETWLKTQRKNTIKISKMAENDELNQLLIVTEIW